MLLRFTSPDMLNTSLLDVATGERAYDIVTVVSEAAEEPQSTMEELHSLSSSISSVQVSDDAPFSSKSSSPTMASSSPAFVKHSHPEQPEDDLKEKDRRTTITDASGSVVAEIVWKGRRPEITICDEKVGALTDLFGSTSVRFMPKILAIPTRFDTDYVWTATAGSLTLFDYDTENVKGTFHQNVIRIPAGSKASKSKLSSPSKFKLSSPSKPTLASTASLSSEDSETRSPRSTFIPTHVPGLGSAYLEFTPHPLAHDIELILSFLMMEILRRGRFNLTPYTFEKPKLWQFKEAKDLLMRRLRRNTV